MALSVEAKRARRTFRENFSTTTAQVVQRIARGQNSYQIADAVGVGVRSVVTTKGNLTRGFYLPFAGVGSEGVIGTCEF